LWFCGVTREEKENHPRKAALRWEERLDTKYPDPAYCYAYSMNGALLYHGPGQGSDVFAVRLGGSNNFWSIHT
jgi:hypothetical protein